MDARKLLAAIVGVTLVALILDAGGGPGWGASSAHAALATRMEHSAASPLYDVLAGVAALLPAGEPGFRLGVLGAVLAALTVGGVIAAAHALLPKDPLAGVVGALLLLVAPPFREAAAFASPAILAACGATWAIAAAATHARACAESTSSPRRGPPRTAIAALAACALVVGSAPWLGAVFVVAITAWLARGGARRELLALAIVALGVLVAVLWLAAVGGLPGASSSLATTLAGSARGAIVVGAGLLGACFGALTGLRGARWLALVIALAAVHEVLFGGSAPVLLAILAIATAILPSAIVRAAQLAGTRRHAATLLAGVPLLAASFATGATLRADAPGATPVQLANDLAGALPAGPGVFLATRQVAWLALAYEQVVAGARPDLALVPPLPPNQADVIAADALRADRVVGADAAAFGRLDLRRAIPRGRGFQLVGVAPDHPSPVEPPARYPTAAGAEQATRLALERARFEAASGRLDAAARAAGLADRFGAADLAVLAATVPTSGRPALFGFLPLDERPAGPWLLDVFGDDLAWVAGIAIAPLPGDAPFARRLHAAWRELFAGRVKPDGPEIAGLGPRAVAATREMLAELKPN